jgi:hypothetical protein
MLLTQVKIAVVFCADIWNNYALLTVWNQNRKY